jgi:hypothetical protein
MIGHVRCIIYRYTTSYIDIDIQGAAEKNKTRKRRTSAPARQKKYAHTFFFFIFFLVRFWAFLGKGSSKTREKK